MDTKKIIYKDESGEYTLQDFIQVGCIVAVFLIALGILGAIELHY